MPDNAKPKTWRVILTVGTSLLSNTGGPARENDGCVIELNSACRRLREIPEGGSRDRITERAGTVREALLALIAGKGEASESELRSRTFHPRDKPSFDRLPQELSYLYLLLTGEDWREDSFPEIFLLASDSDEGRACADIIKGFIDARKAVDAASPWTRVADVRVVGVAGLQADSRTKFEASGAPELIRTIVEVADEAAGQNPECGAIINPTGGFKALIPYATMATAFIDARVYHEMHYLYAESDEIVRLPPYPIGLDFPLWHREENLRLASPKWPGYREALSFRMRAVAPDPNTDATTTIFERAYAEQLQTDPFQNFSEKVIGDLLVGNEEFRSRLLGLLRNVGPHIWLGDKVPMAASHDAHHHQHLMETAQLLLQPMLDADPKFLSGEERFVLLAGVLLHDCGHTVDALPDQTTGKLVRLFPSEVRDLHSFLSYYRLTDKEHAEALGWDPEADLAEEVAWLCVYHRHHTGWKDVEDAFGRGYCPYIEEHIPAPTEAAETFNLSDDIDFPKLVALLRLIDGCDNQTRRVGPPPRAEALEQSFDLDRKVFVEQLRFAAEAAVAYGGEEKLLPGMEFIEQCRTWFNGDTSIPPPEFSRDIRQQLAVGPDDNRVWARLWTDAARARDEIALRGRQLFHFVKHQAVRRVLIYPVGDFVTGPHWSFEVTLTKDDDLKLPDYPGVLDSADFAARFSHELKKQPNLRTWLLRELAREIGDPDSGESTQLHHIAKKSGKSLSFRFRWEDEDDDSNHIAIAHIQEEHQ